ncbi:sugar transferase [Ruminococcus sp. YE282]|jgi:lipopolysaccharide/colanic/teichoic acid biosynthesis glycosyltransferase|uniref:sugar transferase n=1 Tax=Ruminococcus sp. YE282 TaxID=3158780 RepID=UPI00089014D3|nr:sugar transferase [Ruminococcus bromii]SCY39615.1 Sugar transferase involved in LPS biosynthesis (colanic, teichoic acid) [Ruminococcus bromii]
MKSFSKLPPQFRCDEVKEYYNILSHKNGSLILKRAFDIVVSFILLILLIIPIIIIAFAVKLTSEGPVFYRQERVTTYGKIFKILKFRTMVQNADKIGTLVTTDSDSRVTNIGRFLRKYRLDELPQVFNVLSGSMSIVGTRPEVPKYVNEYKPEYYATLLIPAGITSLASIMYKDEEKLLSSSKDADYVYINEILPEKMKYNLQYTKNFGFFSDIKLMFKTVKDVFC